jgi:spermidine synthase
MAVLWQKTIKNVRYEVRTAGQTRRLYTDGVFHSQFNPKRAITGGIWDLLFLPALFYPADTLKRILVLGVGGGAVIHQLQRYIKPDEIVGIELSSVHIMLAKQHFGITDKLVRLVKADAIEWLNNYRGPAFDMIIDDLFGEQDGEPVRAVKANKEWFEKLNSHLSPEGLLVMNFISTKDLKNCAAISYKKTSNMFANVFQFSQPNYDNAIGAFLKKISNKKILQQSINEIAELGKSKKLKFNLRNLK